MTKDEKPKGAEAIKAIEEGLANVFGKLTEALKENGEGSTSEVYKTFGGGKKGPMGVFHSRVRYGTAEEVIRARGSKEASQPKEPVDIAHRPEQGLHADIEVDGDLLFLSCEIPGVTENEVALTVSGREISISTNGGRKYHGTFTLPVSIQSEPKQLTLTNGILEAQFEVIEGTAAP